MLATAAILAAFAAAPPAAGAGGILPVGIDARPVSIAGAGVEYLTLRRERGSVLIKRRRGGGQVLRRLRLGRRFHVPTLAYDGSLGGLSADGRRLVLIGYPQRRARRVTEFALIDAKRLRLERIVRLRGHFSFHALSRHGSQMYVINYAPWDMAEFAVRSYDVRERRLRPGDISEPAGGDGPMDGIPITRAAGPGGRWQYTLYGVIGDPYLHALDTRTRRAYRTPLAEPRARIRTWWRVRLQADRTRIHVVDGNRMLATVDAPTHRLVLPARPEADAGGLSWLAIAGPTAALILFAAASLRIRAHQP